MIESGSRLGLSGKKCFLFLICKGLVMEKLEGDDTFELEVLRLVDDAHATTPKLFEDFVMRDRLTDHDSPGERTYNITSAHG